MLSQMARYIILGAKSRLSITPLLDVSREANMGGNGMSTALDSGCVSNTNICVFECSSGSTFGDSGTYSLVNCAAVESAWCYLWRLRQQS